MNCSWYWQGWPTEGVESWRSTEKTEVEVEIEVETEIETEAESEIEVEPKGQHNCCRASALGL